MEHKEKTAFYYSSSWHISPVYLFKISFGEITKKGIFSKKNADLSSSARLDY
jgi:hypothetical protein